MMKAAGKLIYLSIYLSIAAHIAVGASASLAAHVRLDRSPDSMRASHAESTPCLSFSWRTASASLPYSRRPSRRVIDEG